mgnify:CR=1 FL=1
MSAYSSKVLRRLVKTNQLLADHIQISAELLKSYAQASSTDQLKLIDMQTRIYSMIERAIGEKGIPKIGEKHREKLTIENLLGKDVPYDMLIRTREDNLQVFKVISAYTSGYDKSQSLIAEIMIRSTCSLLSLIEEGINDRNQREAIQYN